MAKPLLSTVRFAVDGADADSPLIGTGPASGLRDTGYALNDIPTSADFDYLLNKHYRWFQYLDAGAFEGASSFNSTLAIAGALTVNAAAFIAGAITIGGNTTIGAPLVVADFVFTADNTTDTMTKVAHGLLTGDGPVRVSNAGGGLPAGLVAATDYWVIRLTADTFKLATSLLLALAGTPIDITTNGTGTQTLADTAGTLRSASLTVDGALNASGGGAVTLNTLAVTGASTQAAIAATTVNASGLLTALAGITSGGLITANAGITAGTNQHITLQGGRLRHGIITLQFPFELSNDNIAPFKAIDATHPFVNRGLDLPIGISIDCMRVTVKDNATGSQSLGAQLGAWVLTPTNTHNAVTNNSNGSGAVQILTTSVGLGFTVISGEIWSVAVFYNGGAATQVCTVGMVELDVFQV